MYICNKILVISSAAVYAASFFYIDTLWWGCFIFLTPLFFVHFSSARRALLYGFMWSIVAYLPHILCVMQVVHTQALCYSAYSIVLLIMLCFFIPTAFWFLAMHCGQKQKFYPYSFLLSSFLYSWYIYYGLFLLLGIPYGYPLAWPLLPFFVVYQQCGYYLWAGGKWLLYGLVITAQIMVLVQVRVFLFIVLIGGGWYTVIFLITPSQQKQDTIFTPVYPVYDQRGLQQLVYVQEALRMYTHKKNTIMVLPESAISFDYTKIPYLATLLTDDVGLLSEYILFGTHINNQGKTYNVLALAHDGRITVVYVKQHLMPFFEKPHWIEDFFHKELFLKQQHRIWPGSKVSFIEVSNVGYLCPLICSESLWHIPWGQPFPLVVLVHDAHFSYRYIKRLMRAAITLQAQITGVELIYSSYAL